MQSTTPKPRRGFRILLAVSLALNLLFVGLVAGAVWRGAKGHGIGPRGAGLQNYAAPYVQALPKAQRRAFHRDLRKAHPQMGRGARAEGYARMIDALRSTPFDAEAIRAVLAEQAQLGAGVMRTGQNQWLSAVTQMDAQERRAYADRLEERLARRGKRKRTPPPDSN